MKLDETSSNQMTDRPSRLGKCVSLAGLVHRDEGNERFKVLVNR